MIITNIIKTIKMKFNIDYWLQFISQISDFLWSDFMYFIVSPIEIINLKSFFCKLNLYKNIVILPRVFQNLREKVREVTFFLFIWSAKYVTGNWHNHIAKYGIADTNPSWK